MMTNFKEGLVATDPTSTKTVEPSSREELIRQLRQMMIAELDAANLYEQLASSLSPEFSQIAELLRDVADEEIVHVGEFIKALHSLDPEEEKNTQQGEEEAKDLLSKLSRAKESAQGRGSYLYFDAARKAQGAKPWCLKDIATDALIASFSRKSDALHFLKQQEE